METIQELLQRKIESKLQDIRDARLIKDRTVAEAVAEGDRLVEYHKGQLEALEKLVDLDWNLYAKNHLEAK